MENSNEKSKCKPVKGYALVGRDRKIHIMDIVTSKKIAKEIMERSILIKEIILVLITPINNK
jgi:hypothetical protein